MLKKIVIYGGSFNPPHVGHAAAIDAVKRLFACNEIWVMPSGNRRDKPLLADGKHRLAMCKIMLKDYFPKSVMPIKISDLEIKRQKLTTTFETQKELAKNYPGVTFYFLVGSDLLADIETRWVNGKKVFNTVNFIAILKPRTALPKRLPKNLTILDNDILWPMVSSTFIRALIKKRHSPLPYVAPGVAAYIKKYHLYE